MDSEQWGEEIKPTENHDDELDGRHLFGEILNTIYSSPDTDFIRKMLSNTNQTTVIRMIRTIVTDCYEPFGKIENPYKSVDITTDNFDVDNLIKIISECKEYIHNECEKTIVKCSICGEHSCTKRYIMDGLDDTFVGGSWCPHECNIYKPTKLLIDVHLIEKICCNCVNKLVQDGKLEKHDP